MDNQSLKAVSNFIETRLIYDTAHKLWEINNWPSPPLVSLPPEAICTYFEDQCDILAVAFIYKTDSNLAWFEWLVCSPEVRREPRSEIINSTIKFAEDYAKTHGLVLFTSIKSVNLLSRLESRNWKKTDGGMTNFIFS